VLATAIDARNDGFAVRVLLPMVAGVAEATSRQALADMEAAGVQLCPPT
jgi:nicotinamidase/pyrazinamidase